MASLSVSIHRGKSLFQCRLHQISKVPSSYQLPHLSSLITASAVVVLFTSCLKTMKDSCTFCLPPFWRDFLLSMRAPLAIAALQPRPALLSYKALRALQEAWCLCVAVADTTLYVTGSVYMLKGLILFFTVVCVIYYSSQVYRLIMHA